MWKVIQPKSINESTEPAWYIQETVINYYETQ